MMQLEMLTFSVNYIITTKLAVPTEPVLQAPDPSLEVVNSTQ